MVKTTQQSCVWHLQAWIERPKYPIEPFQATCKQIKHIKILKQNTGVVVFILISHDLVKHGK